MSRIRVGLIGCGTIARLVHLGILRQLPDAELIAVAETDPKRREDAASAASGAKALSDYHDLLDLSDVQAVVICLPTFLHSEAAIAAVQKGKHVYLEKPVAADVAGAKKVVEAWQASGVVGMIGFNYRFHSLYQEAKQLLISGRIGSIVAVRSIFATAAQDLPEWKRSRESGGGVLLELTTHHVDLVRFLFQTEIREIFASIRTLRSQDDCAATQLILQNGVIVQSFCSLGAVEEDRFEIYGDAGKLMIDRHRSLRVEISAPAQQSGLASRISRVLRNSQARTKLLHPTAEPSYQAALAKFISAAKEGRQATPDFTDGLQSLLVIEAAEESVRTGRSVDVSGL